MSIGCNVIFTMPCKVCGGSFEKRDLTELGLGYVCKLGCGANVLRAHGQMNEILRLATCGYHAEDDRQDALDGIADIAALFAGRKAA